MPNAAPNRLSNAESYKLCKYLEERKLKSDDTYAALAVELGERAGRILTVDNVRGLFLMMDISIPRGEDPVELGDRIKLLAQCINAISLQLGIELSTKLKDLL